MNRYLSFRRARCEPSLRRSSRQVVIKTSQMWSRSFDSFQSQLNAPLREAYLSCIEEIRRDEAWELMCDREAEGLVQEGGDHAA
jgi:hypothetical protein